MSKPFAVPMSYRCLLLLLVVVSAGGLNSPAAEKPFVWQRDYARVTETGDIQWTPREFRFMTEGEVRFIDPQKGVKPSPTCQFSRKLEGLDGSFGAKSL